MNQVVVVDEFLLVSNVFSLMLYVILKDYNRLFLFAKSLNLKGWKQVALVSNVHEVFNPVYCVELFP